ncbi:MAG: transporter ATP-binding protein [Symbiobacteriaceae bacterium]|nr:transporter ATP-binding protein [Symbiobacteriaceae bacterium]
MQACRIAKVHRPDGPDPVWALRNIDLRIYAGDFITILGAPGAGKSTLLRILGLQEPPTHGDLYYEGRLITGLTTNDLQPDLLLLDEPTHAMTQSVPVARTVILATADPEIAALGSTIYRLTDGSLYLIGG